MAKAKSNMKKLVSGLNEMADKEFNYKKAILIEDQKFGKGSLKERQKKVVDSIMEDLNIKEGGTKQMKPNKGGVKTKVATKKVVPPNKVNMLQIGEKAEGFLRGLETGLDGVKYELEKVYIGEVSFKQNSRLIFGIRYRVCGDKVTYSLVAKETFKNFSKELQGKYSPGNWNILFDFTNGDDIKKFNPIIKASLEKLKKAKEELPKDKAKK